MARNFHNFLNSKHSNRFRTTLCQSITTVHFGTSAARANTSAATSWKCLKNISLIHCNHAYLFPVCIMPGFRLVDLSAAKNISIGAISYPYGPEMIVLTPIFAR